MNKVILLALLMPVTAFGQIMKKSGPGIRPDRLQVTRFDSDAGRASPGDVIISEIMADPSPAVALPAKEYIEIFNRSGFPFNLEGWILTDGNSRSVFPVTIIPPRSFMILCQLQDTLVFSVYGRTTGLRSFPALTDGGKLLYLTDNSTALIHGVEYSSRWYGDVLKDGGGWSLEVIDTDYPFFQEGNWCASVSGSGGTPGKINSVAAENPDPGFSGIENVFPSDSVTVNMRLSETLIGLDNNTGKIKIEGTELNEVRPSDPLFRSYSATLVMPLQKGRIYSLSVDDEVADFAGNTMERKDFSFGLPEPVHKGDILFNELLFNPFPGEPDYIEFYNCSGKILDAFGMMIVSVNDQSGDTSSVAFVSSENRCILPGNYNVITSEKDALLERFYSSDPYNIFEVRSLPSMPDDKGHLILYSRDLEKIDEVFYEADMHFPLLGGNEGIALEKVRTNGLSTDRSQWHSASGASGWGTPGMPNSVLSGIPGSVEMVTLSSTRITPDNDGNEDLLVIDLKLAGIGNVVSVTLFDEAGRYIKKITDNMLTGAEATIVWNGTADNERLVGTGMYILLIEVFDDKGKIRKWKKVCTVIRK